MALWDWDEGYRGPWREIERMRQRMDRLFHELTGTVAGAPFPPVNVWSNDEKAVVTAELPGTKMENLDISVESDVLTLRGSREPEKLEQDETYHRHERGYGSFTRNVALPFAVDAEKVQATYKDGVLTVSLPRTPASRPKKIEVKG